MLSVIAFLLVLSVLILIHEWGHFFAARKFGIWVEEFGLGLPPRAWGKKIGETIYSLNWLPIGGFVRLHGENLEETISNSKRAFLNKSKKIRVIVICAGVFMNLVLGILAFSIVYSFTGIPRETGFVRVLDVSPSSPAQEVGLKKDDIVESVDGIRVKSNEQFIGLIEEKKGKEVELLVKRNGEKLEKKVTPRVNPPAQEGSIGVAITSKEVYFAPLWQRPFVGVYFGFKEALFWGKAILAGLGTMVKDLFGGQVPQDIAGPVGIYTITKEVAELGILPLINFMGILSVNLAIINILPIPALDGGRLLFIIIEAVTKKRVTPKIESTIHAVGMTLLIMLLLGITFFDIRRLALSGSLSLFLQNIFR